MAFYGFFLPFSEASLSVPPYGSLFFFLGGFSQCPSLWPSILSSHLSSFFLNVLPCGFLFFLPSFVASPTVSFRLAFSPSFPSSQLLSNTGRQNQTAEPNVDNILHLIFTL